MPVKKSIRAKKSRRMNTSSRLSKFTRLTRRQIGARWMGLAMICVITAGMLISSQQLSRPADEATVDTRPQNTAIEAEATTASVAIAPKTRANAADKAHVPAVVSAAKEPAAELTAVAIAPRTRASAADEAYAPAVVPAQEGSVVPAEEGSDPGDRSFQGQTLVKAPAAELTTVTITGCLERADETTFRLRDTVGEDAPKSRSWKSGFLKKGSASIEVVDAAHRLKLPDHVGQKVTVTGTLVDREMQVRSLSRVATSCADSPKVRV